MTTVVDTPIQQTLARVSSRFQYVSAGYGPPDADWRPVSEMNNDPDAIEQWIGDVFNLYQMDDRRVASAFLILGYFWYATVGAMGCLLLENRLPDMSATNLSVNPARGVRFLSPGFLVLPDDPDAGSPDATVVADRQAMRAYLMETLETEHVAPLFATLRSVTRYGIPAMRANYLDRIVSTIMTITDQLGDNDLAREEVAAFMALAGPKVRSGIISLTHEGREGVFLLRGGCCLNHHLPGREKCDTCSIIPMEQRLETFRGYLSAT